jgi:hypothetical protein
LKAAYPEHEWPATSKKIHTKPYGYWMDVANQRLFFDDLAKKLNITKPEDWYSISSRTVKQNGGHFLSKYNTSVIQGTISNIILKSDYL